MVLSAITFTLVQILGLLLGLYAAIVVMTILLDNRTPQSAFAWRILILGFPVIGLLIYIFFGRGYKTFRNETKLARIGGLSTPHGLTEHIINALKGYLPRHHPLKSELRGTFVAV